MICILLASALDVMRRGPRGLLEADHPDWMVCAEPANGREAVVLALQAQPDAAILDPSMPGLNGIDAKNYRKSRVTTQY